MIKTSLSAFCIAIGATSVLADWPQWRGPNRNGVSSDTTPIAETFPASGLKKVWESDYIPSDHFGGHGSPVIVGEKAFISVVWHERVPSEQREIDAEVMSQLNYRGVNPELAKKMEETRLNLPPLRGAKFDEWVLAWRKEHLTEREDVSLGKWVESRFKAGKTALPLEELARVSKREGKPFENLDALKKWIDDEKLSSAVQEKLLTAIPNTSKVARDVVVCLDMNSGKQLWKFETEGKPTGRKSSSTAAVDGDRVFAAGSTHLYCLSQEDGKEIWRAPLPTNGPAASPLVVGEVVYMAAGRAQAFAVTDGRLLWEQKDARGDTGSPVYWTPDSGEPVVVIVGPNDLYGLAPRDGRVLWTVAGGGQSTPVASGDWMVVYSGVKDVGLRAYQFQKEAAPKPVWSHFWTTMRYSGSPILHEGHVYLTCGGKHQCVELATGKILWSQQMESTITSPIMADGKLIMFQNNGSHLGLVKADPSAYTQLARLKIEGMGCTSPALSNGKLLVRQREKIACFDLRPEK
jgi:outer membrane protein assembly factor BamB